MESSYNLVHILKIWIKWKWYIFVAVLLSALISALVSVFVMDEYYLSRSVIYPINQSITDRSHLFNEKGSEAELEYYGTKNDVNRLLEIANSAQITDFLINYYHLADHYHVNKNSAYWKTKVKKKFLKNYKVIKTEREAVEVTIFDTNPDSAAIMVNTAVEKIDEINKMPVVKNKLRIADRFSEDVIAKKQELDSLTDQLNALGVKYNVSLKVDDKGNTVVNASSAEGVVNYKLLQQIQLSRLTDYNKLVMLKDQYALSAKENVPSIYVVEEPYPSEKREKPVRSLVVLSSVLITVILSLIAVLLIEKWREIMEQL
jgi:capsular polysaccharide biosynthesis protein